MAAVLLAGTPAPHVVELWSWKLAPGERYSSGAHTGGTREMLTAEHGSVRLEVADEAVTLAPGDPAAFSGVAAYAGPPRLVRAVGNEAFETTTNGEPTVEHPEPGEVV